MSTSNLPGAGPSHAWAREKYNRRLRADTYPAVYENTRHDRRELKCISRLLERFPAGGRVLDIPCGKGRLTRVLAQRGYRVTAADAAEEMLVRGRENYADFREQTIDAPPIEFELRDVLATGYADNQFDAVTCVRLFHHFYESATRRRALCELRRICRGPILLTFRNSFALDFVRYWVRSIVLRNKKFHMMPISMKTFADEIAYAGLQIDDKVPAVWGISSRWYLLLSRREKAGALQRDAA